ncbi:MAG: SUKH-4 family immunity protein [Cyanobacteria bacterium SID2]|nr:SUKH-4 family immunity protein [Cyanobacteria bacterium SID2]MBP0006579.1 SUKH-4 family immunity protein [Cyanobacteria bacterium SBC]
MGVSGDNTSIVCIDKSGLSESFVNTDIICFVKSLVAYKKMESRIENDLENDEVIHQAIEDLEDRLLEIDSGLLAAEEGWWSSVILGIYG